MPTHAQNVCCREHPHASEMVTNNNLQCITDHVGMVELTRPTVLDYNYAMYLNSNHGELKSLQSNEYVKNILVYVCIYR